MKIFQVLILLIGLSPLLADDRPHMVLVMTDDQGWGQTSYNGHPLLKTPHLDAMAANGLRLDRFYAGASNCSPTRASVLTGRTNDRTGVWTHGFPLRLQEKTVAQALSDNGYLTGHFGKWHLNGVRGPGVPVLKDDTHHPGHFGFEHWLTTTNFFDVDPILSRMGEFEEFQGDSSEVTVDEALKFIKANADGDRPLFVVIWYGSPHSPMVASDDDMAPFAEGSDKPDFQAHHGELVAMDRSVGALREGLRDLGIAENTIVWFNSDNGGLKGYGDEHTMGGLRGSKNTMYEGGLRVPGIIEWPAKIKEGRITNYPAGTVDIFPTLADAAGLDLDEVMLSPRDGVSLLPLFEKEIDKRDRPLIFRHSDREVLIDNDAKIIRQKGKVELYDLAADHSESNDLSQTKPAKLQRMLAKLDEAKKSIDASRDGADYPSGKVDPNQPERLMWTDMPRYQPYFEEWKDRPEYKSRFKGK
ncbi:MAG: sulfatase-like hydrolase/transferase [Verrucomicrobiota bacterium]